METDSEKKRAVTLAAGFLAFGSGLGAGFWGLKKDNRMKEVKNSVITDNAKTTMSVQLFSDTII